MTAVREAKTRFRTRATGWREFVLARATLIRAELAISATAAPAEPATVAVAEAVETHLEAAEQAARPARRLNPMTRLRGWWTGAPVDAAWVNLHHAEVVLVDARTDEDLRARRPAVTALVDRMLAADDPRREEARKRLAEDDWTTVTPAHRAAYRAALRWGFVACDEQYARVRSLRNLLFIATLLLSLLAIALAYLGARQPHLISLCFSNATPVTGSDATTGAASAVMTQSCPAGRHGPTGPDLALVELLGLVGGALSAMVSIRGMRGTSTPYSVPVALAVLKLPAGALVSLTALILLAGNFLPGLSGLDSTGQILAYALVLGYAQQIVTRLVDRQAHTVLNKVPSSETAPTPPPGPLPTQEPAEDRP